MRKYCLPRTPAGLLLIANLVTSLEAVGYSCELKPEATPHGPGLLVLEVSGKRQGEGLSAASAKGRKTADPDYERIAEEMNKEGYDVTEDYLRELDSKPVEDLGR